MSSSCQYKVVFVVCLVVVNIGVYSYSSMYSSCQYRCIFVVCLVFVSK